MRLDVLLGDALPAPADVVGRAVIVIDVLRAATTVVTALANGARAVIPFESVDEPTMLAKQYERGEVRLAGERKMQRIPGFDLGNSPGEYARDVVEGRTILYSTTNGTAALVASQGARWCWFAAFVNGGATVAAVRAATKDEGDVTIVCAGSERRSTLEDVVCAGRLARGIMRGRPDAALTDGARMAILIEKRYGNALARLAADASHAQALTEAGFADDVARCLSVDTLPVVVTYQNRQLTSQGAASSRDVVVTGSSLVVPAS